MNTDGSNGSSKEVLEQCKYLFVLKLKVPINNGLVMSLRSHNFLGFNRFSWEYMCPAQGRLDTKYALYLHKKIYVFDIHCRNKIIMFVGRSGRPELCNMELFVFLSIQLYALRKLAHAIIQRLFLSSDTESINF